MEIFETDRLRLTLFTPELYHELFSTKSESELIALLGAEGKHNYAELRRRWKIGMRTYRITFAFFQLRLLETGRILGGAGFHNYMKDADRAEIGYALEDERDYNKGYMTEALSIIVPYGFNVLKLNRVEAFISPDNYASQKLVERWGFNKEGLLREHYKVNDVYVDSLAYALLRSEWNVHS